MSGRASDHFLWKEFYCPDAKMVPVSDLTLNHVEKLEKLRLAFGKPLRVNSGYRSPSWNANVGGAERSMHLEFATDLAPTGGIDAESLHLIYRLGKELGFSGIGRYATFVHLDCREFIGRTRAEWDNRT